MKKTTVKRRQYDETDPRDNVPVAWSLITVAIALGFVTLLQLMAASGCGS